jgi:hypothetical protein
VPLTTGAPEAPARFRVVRSDARGTVVELSVDGLYVEPVQAGGQSWQTIELGIAAGGHTVKPGRPQLPLVARFLEISADRAVRVEVTALEEVTLTGYKVYPAQPAQPESRDPLPFEYDAQAYSVNAPYPSENTVVSEPMIMRDVRLVQLAMQPVRYNPVTGELRVARRLQVTLHNEGQSTVNVLRRRPGGHSRAFVPLYRSLIPNYDDPPQRPEDGSYLIITHDDFAAAVAPFAAWKHQKGWRTTVVTTSELGGNDSAHIDAYITNAYENWPYPPDFVLLVGDAPTRLACCHWPGRTDASDLRYSLKSGTDILADLMISRVCVQTQAEAVAVLNKLYKYEMTPWMGNTDWYDKVVSLAGYEGNPRFWSMVIRVRNYVMGRPFTQFDTLFERWGLNTATNLSESLNQGRAWMLYRGHGDVGAWANVSPSWSNSNVLNLNNGRMTPCVIAPTCLSGDFDNVSQDCHAETWLKAGEEKGGCAYFGSSEVSYSGYNDSLATGSFLSYTDSLMYTFAQCTQWGKLFMMQAYPLPDNITEEETYMFNNFGEPELNVWSTVPRTLSVAHPPTVLIGSFPFTVTVHANDAPVANALVCVMSRADTTVYHVGHTDGSGQVSFTLNTTLPGDSILVTVTGRNLHPYLGAAIAIAPNSAYVTYLRCTVSDSAGGNNDGIINPGEAIRLPTWVKNWGSRPANTVNAKLRSADANITVTDSAKSFGNIPAGDSASTGANGFGFTVAPACTNGYTIRLDLECRDALDSVWNSGIALWVGTAELGYAGLDVDDAPPGGNGDGKVDPGETANLFVTLRNTGLGHGYNVNATLRSGDARFTVPDSTAGFGRIMRDTTGVNADPFTVAADASIPRETAIPCTLVVRADGGYTATLAFQLVIGEVRAIDPIGDGPRTPSLYWAYEDCDSAYDEAPVFEWVDVAGIGTRLTLSDDQTVVVSLPPAFGPFRFYGQNFTQVSVCGNGWVGLGSTTVSTYSNTALPATGLPPAVFLNWDDLYPPTGGGVWWYHDTANHRFVVQYDSVPYYSSRTVFEFNQVIFYDTTRAADDGNCEFTVQYLTAQGMNSSTVGEQDPTRAIYIQSLFNGAYHRGASTMAAGRAVKYTTDAPSTAVAEPGAGTAARFERLGLAPNPVRGGALVRFGVKQAGVVRLAVYDRAGRQVRTLADGRMDAGQYSVRWDGRDAAGRSLSQGVYFLRLDTGSERTSLKAVLLD